MTFGTDDLQVVIQDFGTGAGVRKKTQSAGLGLIAMRERAELLNGKFEITSAPGAGTRVSILMPLKQDDTASEAEEESMEEVFSRQND